MSDRRHWKEVKSSITAGDVISGCRDNDTKSYRLFVNNGWRDGDLGYSIDSCACCDLSIEDLRKLYVVIAAALESHEPFEEFEGEG